MVGHRLFARALTECPLIYPKTAEESFILNENKAESQPSKQCGDPAKVRPGGGSQVDED